MKKILSAVVLVLSIFSVRGQGLDDGEINAGDWLQVGPCPKDRFVFKYIEIHRKTRIVPDSVIGYDTLTGEGFSQWFFAEGDFDSGKLPCVYANKKFQVAALQELTDSKTGKKRQVVFLFLDNRNTVAWVELEEAVEHDEIVFE